MKSSVTYRETKRSLKSIDKGNTNLAPVLQSVKYGNLQIVVASSSGEIL